MISYGVSITNFHFSKKHPYTIKFDAAYSRATWDISFEYIGSDIINATASFPDDVKEDLLEQINEDYGDGPFTREKIAAKFKKAHNHYVKQGKESEED